MVFSVLAASILNIHCLHHLQSVFRLGGNERIMSFGAALSVDSIDLSGWCLIIENTKYIWSDVLFGAAAR